MVLPLIAAGIGVIGAVSQIKAQSDAARAQNAQIAGQIRAEQKNEEIRLAMAAFDKQQIEEQAKMEGAQRRAAFREQANALTLASIQVNAELAVEQARAATQLEMNRRGVNDLARNIEADRVNTRANTTKQRADVTRQVAAQSTLDPAIVNEVKGRAARVRNDLQVKQVGGGVTSGNVVSDNSGTKEATQAIADSLRAEGAGLDELAAVDNYIAADEKAREVERGLTRANAEQARVNADSRIANALQTNAQLASVLNAATETQRRQLRLGRRIDSRNAALARQTAIASVDSNSNLAAAKSAFAQQQAYSQRASGPSFGSALASIGQQALPLVSSLVPVAQVRQPDQFSSTTLGTAISNRLLVDNRSNYQGTFSPDSRFTLPPY